MDGKTKAQGAGRVQVSAHGQQGGKAQACPFPRGASPHQPWGGRCVRKAAGAAHELTTSPPAPCRSWLVRRAGSPGSPLCRSASCKRTARAKQLQRPPPRLPSHRPPPGGHRQHRGREWTRPGLRAAEPPEAGEDARETGGRQAWASTLGVGGSLDATHPTQPARVSKGHSLFGAGAFGGPGPPRGRQKRTALGLSSTSRPR